MKIQLAQIALVTSVLASASGCSTNAFDVTLRGSTTISGDASTAGDPLTRIPAFGSLASINFSASEEFRHYGVTKEGVQSLQLSQLTIQVINPGTQGFEFLDEVAFFAGDGTNEVLVAGKSGIAGLGLQPPNPLLSLEVVQSVELRDFLGAPAVSLTARGSGRVPPQNTTLQATATLRVVLKVI